MQPQFELEQSKVTLVHLNPRTEKQGDADVPACDLKIQLHDTNGMLAMFHPTLRSHLYESDSADQTVIEGVEGLTRRRFGSLIERVRLSTSLKGADVVIGFGLGDKSDIHLDTVDVDSFNLDLLEGGTVGLTFRIKARPTGEQMRRLYEVMGGEVDLTVTPAVEKQGSLGLPEHVE